MATATATISDYYSVKMEILVSFHPWSTKKKKKKTNINLQTRKKIISIILLTCSHGNTYGYHGNSQKRCLL